MKERIIGNYTSNHQGPLLFISGGIHGNEPSGIEALRKVFRELEKSRPRIEGRIIGITGNTGAIAKAKRFLDEDLNRTWTEENISNKPGSREQEEMHEIIGLLQQHPASQYTKRYFLDCHTTSSESLPYISVQDVNDNDAWAQQFPGYKVRGFSDIIYGAIDHYLSRTGLTGFVFEAGRHTDPASMDNHEGMIWLALEKACCLHLPDLSTFPECVEKFTKRAPQEKTLEIIYRHEIKHGDNFKMEPGYDNFQKIQQGELLARDKDGEIRSEWEAYIFMPLYQSQGNDGFFVVQEV